MSKKKNILEELNKVIVLLKANDAVKKANYIMYIISIHIEIVESKQIWVDKEKDEEYHEFLKFLIEVYPLAKVNKEGIPREHLKDIVHDFQRYYCYKYDTLDFFDLEYYNPSLVNLEVHEILFWILNVKMTPEKIASHNLYFYIRTFQFKDYDKDIKDLMIKILDLIVKRISHGRKS